MSFLANSIWLLLTAIDDKFHSIVQNLLSMMYKAIPSYQKLNDVYYHPNHLCSGGKVTGELHEITSTANTQKGTVATSHTTL